MRKYFYNSNYGNRTYDLGIVMTYTFVDSVGGLYTVMSLQIVWAHFPLMPVVDSVGVHANLKG